jgi:hypothetical protein
MVRQMNKAFSTSIELNPDVDGRCERPKMPSLDPIWTHHVQLLGQALGLMARMQSAMPAGYFFGQRLGPHLRHILEHYGALFDGLIEQDPAKSSIVDYDARSRDRMIETDPAMAQAAIEKTLRLIASLQNAYPNDVDLPMTARFATGEVGESSLTVMTSLGRELLFLESHTVHHFALLAKYARGLGVDLGSDFGKAPATIAYERRMSAAGH